MKFCKYCNYYLLFTKNADTSTQNAVLSVYNLRVKDMKILTIHTFEFYFQLLSKCKYY